MLIALIPARSGSKRVPNKNIRELCGHPLLAYTIQVAKDSGLFGEHIYVSSDSDEYLVIAERYGARPFKRKETHLDITSDHVWINEIALEKIQLLDICFILRPTNPFRTVGMLNTAHNMFINSSFESLRAMEIVKQRPEKMWYPEGVPYTEGWGWLEQSSSFNRLYVQNGALEILHGYKAYTTKTSGSRVLPYITQGYEGFDINTEDDWILAEALIERGLAKLPEIKI